MPDAEVGMSFAHSLPDVIVPDVFAGHRWHRAFQYIRERLLARDRPIVAMSSYYTSNTRQEALDWGFSEFLSKPFDPMKLIPFLESVVRGDSAA
jgi:CheY-like chemotaxis protein